MPRLPQPLWRQRLGPGLGRGTLDSDPFGRLGLCPIALLRLLAHGRRGRGIRLRVGARPPVAQVCRGAAKASRDKALRGRRRHGDALLALWRSRGQGGGPGDVVSSPVNVSLIITGPAHGLRQRKCVRVVRVVKLHAQGPVLSAHKSKPVAGAYAGGGWSRTTEGGPRLPRNRRRL